MAENQGMCSYRRIGMTTKERRPPSHGDGLPTLVDIDGLAEHLGDSVRHVRRLVAERRIPYLKIGGFVRFDPDDIRRWLDEQRRDVTK
jgi:excisionase family DNA binding protein